MPRMDKRYESPSKAFEIIYANLPETEFEPATVGNVI